MTPIHAPETHSDPIVLHLSILFPAMAVITLAGDPTTAPIGKILTSNADRPRPIAADVLEECARTCRFGLGVLIAARHRKVADAARKQLVAWLKEDGGRS